MPGVEVVEVVGPSRLRFTLTGPPAPALRALAAADAGLPVTAVEARAGQTPVVPAIRAAGRAVTWLAVRQIRRGGVNVIVLLAGMSAMVAATYASTVGDTLDAKALAALAENPAIRTLFGEPVALDDPGGFTAWRTGTVLAVLAGVWGLLVATRINPW